VFDESKHPRDENGRFTDGSGTGKTYRQNTSYAEILADGRKKNKIKLSKQEYGALRKEVMRKNVARQGKAKYINCAYTANYFYIYKTNGGDSFVPLLQFDIERDRDEINDWLNVLGG